MKAILYMLLYRNFPFIFYSSFVSFYFFACKPQDSCEGNFISKDFHLKDVVSSALSAVCTPSSNAPMYSIIGGTICVLGQLSRSHVVR